MSEQALLEDLTLRQLRLVAQRYRVSRYSRMTKQELLENILIAQTQQAQERPRNLGKEDVEMAKYQTGGTALTDLLVDGDLGELPAGYGESRVVLLPRDPQWAYAYWDVPNEHKQALREAGGQTLLLRLYDVTNLNFNGTNAHTLIEFPCDELAREWYVPIPVSDRDFVVDIGYKSGHGEWLLLARSAPVRVPPMYPSDWVSDHFVSIPFLLDLQDKSFAPYQPPIVSTGALGISAPEAPPTSFTPAPTPEQTVIPSPGLHTVVYDYVAGINAPAGSVASAEQQLPGAESGLGLSGGLTTEALGQQPLPLLSLFSGLFSGQYYSGQYGEAERKRGFWLVAGAELIIYGATEPDATVTLGGQTILLNPDGTFRFHYQFPDGLHESSVVAVAADGEQQRAITMRFLRQTPLAQGNTKEEMVVAPY
ncbi:DUF4912 domain-containing protein [Candidatus Cyanaurora vandensis]|uniref:DUF4912 domain-containing protein n=1 Tax=Candidatus Cyanaurora vandensis TaxID=2714958 RepID=UPI00257E3213|nr:DUF4912 domain-containing protein [Candidatus Cyanaurora vandensis]